MLRPCTKSCRNARQGGCFDARVSFLLCILAVIGQGWEKMNGQVWTKVEEVTKEHERLVASQTVGPTNLLVVLVGLIHTLHLTRISIPAEMRYFGAWIIVFRAGG